VVPGMFYLLNNIGKRYWSVPNSGMGKNT